MTAASPTDPPDGTSDEPPKTKPEIGDESSSGEKPSLMAGGAGGGSPPDPPSAFALDLREARVDKVAQAPVSEVLQRFTAGVDLARFLLFIAAGSIAVLVLYLGLMDSRGEDSVRAVSDKAISLALEHPLAVNAGMLEDAIAALDAYRKNAGAVLSADQLAALMLVSKDLDQTFPISQAQREKLSGCVERVKHAGVTVVSPAAATAGETDELGDCLLILAIAKKFAVGTGLELDRVRLLKEFIKDSQDHHQAFRSFWLQAAQLVLLNLLLPVLTALLGYIFGSQQAGGSSRDAN
jgi:hypothetical protein